MERKLNLRVFVPLGFHLDSPGDSGNARPSNTLPAVLRRHASGADLYLDTNTACAHVQPAPPLFYPEEIHVELLWLAPALPLLTLTNPNPTTVTPPGPRSPERPAEDPPPASDTRPRILLTGVRRVRVLGAITAVPLECAAAAAGQPALPAQLQVFLYDPVAWQRVAASEADMPACAAPPGFAQPRELGPPRALSLRLALRPTGNPWLRHRTPDSTPKARGDSKCVDATPSECTTSQCAARERTASGCTAAESGGVMHPGKLPLALVRPQSLGPRQAVAWLADVAVRHTATGRHAHHMATCIAALYDMYNKDGSIAPSTAFRSEASGRSTQRPRGSPDAGRSRALAVRVCCLLVALALQLLAGQVVGVLVWRHRARLLGAVEGAAGAAERQLRGQYDWLMTATPAGVKLHADLCQLLGVAAHGGLTAAAAVGRWGWRRCGGGLAGLLAGACVAGGLGGGLAVAHDLLRLASLPLSLQAAASGLLLRLHLCWLGRAWALMCGTWRRPGDQGGGRAASPTSPTNGSTASPNRPIDSLQARSPRLPQNRAETAGTHAKAAAAAAAGHSGSREESDAADTSGRRSGSPPAAAAAAVGHWVSAGKGAKHTADRQPGGHPLGLRWRRLSSFGEGNRLRSSLGSLGEQLGGGVPISRLESLLGLAPDPGSRGEVVVEQLIVGALLAVALLGLLPTAAAFHALAAAAWAPVAVARLALAAAAGALRDNPAVALGWRAARPLDFPGPEVEVLPVGGSWDEGPPPGGSDRGLSGRCCFLVKPLPAPWPQFATECFVRGVRGGWGGVQGRPVVGDGGAVRTGREGLWAPWTSVLPYLDATV